MERMIQQKLLAFQKLNIKVERDAINPHFKNSYSSLNEVLDKVKKPLNDMGVVIIQRPGCMETDEASDFYPGISTTLFDTEDDTSISCFIPYVNATDMQKLGGAITYARRYSLISMLGLEDADDDGNTAAQELPVIRR